MLGRSLRRFQPQRPASAALLAAVATISACGRPAAVSSRRFAAGPAAQARGVAAFQVLRAGPRHLDLLLEGELAGHLEVRAANGNATQRLEVGGAPPLVLRTSWERVTVEFVESTQVLAERTGTVWIAREPLAAAAGALVTLLLALDIDLAVQGTSMTFNGRRYAWCTPMCATAERCARGGRAEACGDAVATCGACLEQEPAQ